MIRLLTSLVMDRRSFFFCKIETTVRAVLRFQVVVILPNIVSFQFNALSIYCSGNGLAV